MTALSTAKRADPADGASETPFWLRAARHTLGKFRPRNRAFYRVFTLPPALEGELLRFDHETPRDRHGRCPFRKMQAMAALIVRQRLKLSVEIGVYRGSSLLPQAMAMRRTGGCAVGIDPWSTAEWRQEYGPRERIDEHAWRAPALDWDAYYHEVLDAIARHGAGGHCRIIRGLSHKVAGEITAGIDLLHIDGNHDSDAVAQDLELYLPKLRRGGFLVMDDITWAGVAPHYAALKRTMPMIWEAPTWGALRKP